MDTTILIVDDESFVLQSLQRALRNESYTIVTALGAEEALGILRSQICKVVISDQKMICTQGIDFLKEVKRLFPETIRQIAPVLNAALTAPLAQRDFATLQAVLDESRTACRRCCP